MSRSIRIYAVGTETEEPTPPVDIPCIRRCRRQALLRRMEQGLRRGIPQEKVGIVKQERAGNKAFREAMPTLAGHDNIRDFIACVAGGMLSEIINANEGAKFLYAAQVASGALNRDTARQKRSS